VTFDVSTAHALLENYNQERPLLGSGFDAGAGSDLVRIDLKRT
jgi:hypothetical protein